MSTLAERVAVRFIQSKSGVSSQAAKIADQAEKTLKKLSKLLFSRRVVVSEVDGVLKTLHSQYEQAERIALATVGQVEERLRQNPDRSMVWELKLLKENLGRRERLVPEGPKSTRDFSTTGNGPERREWTSHAFDYAKNLEGGCVSYARAIEALEG